MHLADAPAMFQSVLSIFICLAIHHVRNEPPCCQKRDCLCGLTTNLCLRVIAKCKTLLVMVAYRTDAPLSSVKLCIEDMVCEVFVKIEKQQDVTEGVRQEEVRPRLWYRAAVGC
jgi:hypothetical protein